MSSKRVHKSCEKLAFCGTHRQALAEPTHTLQNKVIDPKRAQTRGAIEVCRKIFVGGLDPNLPEESIREYFSRFGKVCTVQLHSVIH